MPNCDFYALGSDLVAVLDFVFAQPNWTLIELASRPDLPLREFASTDEVLTAFPKLGGRSEHFQLYSPEMGGRWQARRITFNPGAVPGHTFRYDCEGWGLIQLYFGDVRNRELSECHTNHNSEVRAKNWEGVVGRKVDGWDFKAVTRMSSRLNRFIRKQAVAKRGSRPILPAAQEALTLGKITIG